MSGKDDRERVEHFTQALQAIERHAADGLSTGPDSLDPATALGLIQTVASDALKSG